MKTVAAVSVAALVAVSFLAGCAGRELSGPDAAARATRPREPAPAPAPADAMAGRVKKALELAGENRIEIEKFLNGVPATRRKAAEFLVAYMPTAALASLSAEDIRSEFDLAYEAREKFPWARSVPESFFLHYVLPNFVTQEPFHRYRAYLMPLLEAALKDCKDARAAALELNRWCGAHFRYVHTQARDQGVFENLKRGFGRCEEMAILYIAAARTVGIPARVASTPLWSTCDSNHAWVEVRVGDAWCYLGACEPADVLNKAWFSNTSKRAPLVVAVAYGRLETDEEIYRAAEKYTIVNTTRWYSPTCRLDVLVESDDGRPLADKEVFLNVFNFGGLRPFALLKTDEKGRAHITMGIGDFVATCSDGGKFAVKKFTTTPGGRVSLTLTPGADDLPDGKFWLRYPKKTWEGR